ncbi:hypothetical protein [Deinococcus knuensis]|uniref:Uncharacterized protein n=1 Tax=Deinococcus knuensis TaxID=1837380 RepID=A0ABQ2SI64_9DEIO|nr:hypothetical protein [Deinococcus knuensis]GGS30458.1 hypothetical protein GCM10008961_22740 [Deinococcus knuensis]
MTTTPAWRQDQDTWRCDLAPGVVLRLRGLQLTLEPVTVTAQLFWSDPAETEFEIGFDPQVDDDGEVGIDAEAFLIGPLAAGEAVWLRLLQAPPGPGGRWCVPPFPAELLGNA